MFKKKNENEEVLLTETEADVQESQEAEENVAEKSDKKQKAEKKPESLKKREFKKKLKYGSLSMVFTAVFIAVIVVVNILVTVIAEKIPQLSIDTTAQQYFELSEESIEFLESLKDYKIELEFIGTKGELKADSYYNKITTLAEKYPQYSENFKVTYVDPDAAPAYASKYDNYEFTVGDAVVKCNDRYRILTAADFLLSDEDENSTSTENSEDQSNIKYSLNAEYAITTAVMVVTASDNPKATVITGHGESELEKLEKMLRANGFEVNDQSILKELDYESNLLIIAAPTKDYSEEDLKKLDDFLYNDGKYGKNIMYVADYSQPKLPNLEAFLYDWGYVIGEGIVYESDENLAYANMPYLNTLTFVDPNITLQSALAEVSAYGYYGRPAVVADVLDVNMESTIELEHSLTSKVGYIKDGQFTKDETSKAINYVAMAVTKQSKYTEDIDIVASNLMFVNSLGFFSDEIFERSYSANPDITMAVIDNMLGRGNNLVLPAKSLSAAALGITYNQANLIGTIAAIVIPVVLLAVCLFVYIRRRFL